MEQKTLDVAIFGAAGFTGRELLRILSAHPHLRIAHITSDRHEGQPAKDVFPFLGDRGKAVFRKHSDPVPSGIPVFLATPNEISLDMVPKLHREGHPVVDLSGVYRFQNLTTFEKNYGLKHSAVSPVRDAVYGMPEVFRDKIRNAKLVANPGCYPTGAIIPLYFLGDLRESIAHISVDAKSGVSGAGGRTEDGGFTFHSVYENFRAYKILRHQHEPEIATHASTGIKEQLSLVFTPHLLPLFRGILSTIVIFWKKEAPSDIRKILQERIRGEKFVRFLDEPEQVELLRVQGTNLIEFSCRSEGRATVIVSAIDNLVKGAAGQAVQNMNLMLGLPEEVGLF